jgi:hypothetical protein
MLGAIPGGSGIAAQAVALATAPIEAKGASSPASSTLPTATGVAVEMKHDMDDIIPLSKPKSDWQCPECLATNSKEVIFCHDCNSEWGDLTSMMLNVPLSVAMPPLSAGMSRVHPFPPLGLHIHTYIYIRIYDFQQCRLPSHVMISIEQCVLTSNDVMTISSKLQHMAYISILQLYACIENVLDGARIAREYEDKHWRVPSTGGTGSTRTTGGGGGGVPGHTGAAGPAAAYDDDDDDAVYGGDAMMMRGGLDGRQWAERDRLHHEALLKLDHAYSTSLQMHADLPGELVVTELFKLLDTVREVLLGNNIAMAIRRRHVDTVIQLLTDDCDDPITMIQQVLARHAPSLLTRIQTILAYSLDELAADTAPASLPTLHELPTPPSTSTPSASPSLLSLSSASTSPSSPSPSLLRASSSLSSSDTHISSLSSSYNPFSSTPRTLSSAAATPVSGPLAAPTSIIGGASTPSSSGSDSGGSLSTSITPLARYNDITVVQATLKCQLWMFAEHVVQARAPQHILATRAELRDAIDRHQQSPIWRLWKGMDFINILSLSLARIGETLVVDGNHRLGHFNDEQLQLLAELLEHLVAARSHQRVAALHGQPVTLRTPYGLGQWIPPLRANNTLIVKLPYGIAYVQREHVELVCPVSSSLCRAYEDNERWWDWYLLG